MCFNSLNMSCALTAPDTPSLGFPVPQQRFPTSTRSRGGLRGPKEGMDVMMGKSQFQPFFPLILTPLCLESSDVLRIFLPSLLLTYQVPQSRFLPLPLPVY